MQMRLIAPFLVFGFACVGNSQKSPTSASLPACEWCGAPEAPPQLSSEATLAGPAEPGRRLTVQGAVFHPDGRTPASGILIYAYQTNAAGIYPKRGDEVGNGRRHGYLRGWVRTGADGRYAIHTIRPEPYPSRGEPAHIHFTVTPPGGEESWIDDIVFDDDSLLTRERRQRLRNLGGSGIVAPRRDSGGAPVATRNIVLERTTPPVSFGREAKPVDTLMVDTAASIVRWTGTKFLGLGSHSGVVRLGAGSLVMQGATVRLGGFAIDMRTIQVTDIPTSDPIPRRRLTDHLRDRDFFWVERYPTAAFVIRSVRPIEDDRYAVDGVLTMRGISQPVVFDATLVEYAGGNLRVQARFEIDRQRWGVAFRGSRLTNDLVDDEIALELDLVARSVRRGVSSAA